MQIVNTLYETKEEFLRMLELRSMARDEECLVRIYAAGCSGQEAVAIARQIKEVLPKAHICGCSGSGIIFENQQYEDKTLVVVEKFDYTKIKVKAYSFAGKTAKQLAQEVAGDLHGQGASLLHTMCADHYYDIHNFVEEFRQLNVETCMVGGVAGDILSTNEMGYVFTDGGLVPQGIVTAALCGEKLRSVSMVNSSHEPISPVYHLNKTQGSLLKEIEGVPVVDWCKEQLGLRDIQHYEDWQVIAENDDLVRFPMILEGHGGASRFIRYESSLQEMSLYFSQINDDTALRIGYCSPVKCVQECMDICNTVAQTPVESLFCYTCLFRKMYLQNCAQWELSPFEQSGVCGVFMMGELGQMGGRNEFLNGCCSLVGIAEQESYIEPDYGVFEDLYQIDYEDEKLLRFVLQKQSSAMTRENQDLMEKLLQQQERFKNQLYQDPKTGLQNAIKYAQDNLAFPYDKMCMIQIENFDLLFSRFGAQGYHHLLRKAVAWMQEFVQNIKNTENISFYSLNDSTIFAVADAAVDESAFMEIAQTMFEHFRFIRLDGENEIFINRFAVVLHQKDMLEKGLSTLESSRGFQSHFLVCDANDTGGQYQRGEMEMIQVLDWAIKNQGIVPYYQGIHDNVTKEITKFEALMRIEDEQGKVYAPYAFMAVAKKYHLYSMLSTQMIARVFADFANRPETVSINLSAFDINFQEMRESIVERLECVGRADNIVFEILEDEEFRNMDFLREFIRVVRKYGVRIAIDDFGSGYSNFMEIARIEPDYIKVDGSIVREVVDHPLSQKVLENIVFLGKQLNAQLVAEFVENERIQARIEEMGIRYSQGYYFAKPVPYQALGLAPIQG